MCSVLCVMCLCMFLYSSFTAQSYHWIVCSLNNHSMLLTSCRHQRARYNSHRASVTPSPSHSSLYSLPPMTFSCASLSSGFPQINTFKVHFWVWLLPSGWVNGCVSLDESAFVVCNTWMGARQGREGVDDWVLGGHHARDDLVLYFYKWAVDMSYVMKSLSWTMSLKPPAQNKRSNWRGSTISSSWYVAILGIVSRHF